MCVSERNVPVWSRGITVKRRAECGRRDFLPFLIHQTHPFAILQVFFYPILAVHILPMCHVFCFPPLRCPYFKLIKKGRVFDLVSKRKWWMATLLCQRQEMRIRSTRLSQMLLTSLAAYTQKTPSLKSSQGHPPNLLSLYYSHTRGGKYFFNQSCAAHMTDSVLCFYDTDNQGERNWEVERISEHVDHVCKTVSTSWKS